MNHIPILYEDNHLLVVVKPANLLSQGDSTGDEDLLSLLKEYIKENTINRVTFIWVWFIGLIDQ